MFKVECPGCQAPYQVDERRVPPTGLKMRCPKCGNSFQVETPADARRTGPSPVLETGIQPADGDAQDRAKPPRPPPRPGPARPHRMGTIAGVAPAGFGAVVPPKPAAAPLNDPYGEVDLPTVGGSRPREAEDPGPPSAPPALAEFDLPAIPPARFEQRAPGSLDLDLPSPAKGRHAERPPADRGELDLPSSLRSRPGPTAELDLPSPALARRRGWIRWTELRVRFCRRPRSAIYRRRHAAICRRPRSAIYHHRRAAICRRPRAAIYHHRRAAICRRPRAAICRHQSERICRRRPAICLNRLRICRCGARAGLDCPRRAICRRLPGRRRSTRALRTRTCRRRRASLRRSTNRAQELSRDSVSSSCPRWCCRVSRPGRRRSSTARYAARASSRRPAPFSARPVAACNTAK